MPQKIHYYGDSLKSIYYQIGKDISNIHKEADIALIKVHNIEIEENPKYDLKKIQYKQPARYLGKLEYEVEHVQ
ncbi:MAG: hypothetical protein ULS35scaffold63_7 [Phage 33_17]|nr:MAG: hypothetical protein ULS35scaffold63_7 [Phage 33_17]